jgi:hypothetical protein
MWCICNEIESGLVGKSWADITRTSVSFALKSQKRLAEIVRVASSPLFSGTFLEHPLLAPVIAKICRSNMVQTPNHYL